MTFGRSTSRRAAWVVALVLLLKAAVPMLAAASAQAQGKTLAEVCTVYGVATVALGGDRTQGSIPSDHAAAQGGEPCTLAALTALTAPVPCAAVAPQPMRLQGEEALEFGLEPHDPREGWLARREHGPPALT